MQTTHWIPGEIVDGQRQPPQPCPDLLTKQEAIRYLRMDDRIDPAQSFDRFRRRHGLPAVAIGKQYLYRRQDLEQTIGRVVNERKR